MGYRVVDAGSVEPTPDRPCTQRALSDPAGLERMAVNRYAADPGEQLPLAYHVHDEQEEAFYVLSGRIAVETPEGTYEAGEDDLFVADPGSPHRAYVPPDADEPAAVLAVGAPPADDVRPYEP